MPFFDEKKGVLSLGGGRFLSPHMPAEALRRVARELGGTCPDTGRAGVAAFPALSVGGGALGLIAFWEENALRALRLSVVSPGKGAAPTAERQRAFLFAALRLKDPCPDTRRVCAFSAPFGSLSLSTDPRTGSALARIAYR